MALVTAIGVQQKRSIHFETRNGTPIANSQFLSIPVGHSVYFAQFQQDYPRVVCRAEPSSFYNCHGLVFASRRTWVDDVQEVRKVLHEDCYTEVASQNALPGDVILYFDEEGDIEHSGIVVSKPMKIIQSTIPVPRVVSKWGMWREVIHYVGECPYSKSNTKYYRVTQ